MKSDNIKDDEIRIIKKREVSDPPKSDGPASVNIGNGHWLRKWWKLLAVISGVAFLVVISWLWKGPSSGGKEIIESAFEPELVEYPEETEIDESEVIKTPLSNCSDTVKTSFVEVIDKMVNDIPMSIYIPHNSSPILRKGLPSEQDENLIFASQAADLRADNGEIVGAFVLAGEPLSWGLSKKGFCAIIDGKVTVGMADNSPLFEEATEKGGYFFRQYALVSNGKRVENNLRNKSLRKALCVRGDEVFVAMTHTRESMHDFSQALVDLGVDNAIYIVGSFSYSLYRDDKNVLHRVNGIPSRIKHKNVNFIEWRID